MRWSPPAALAVIFAAAAAPPPQGYLEPSALPDATRFVGSPPEPGTPAFAADVAAYESAARGRGGPAWVRAGEELDPWSATMREHVACAIGVALDPATTSATLRLLHRSVVDSERAVRRAKAVYRRPRPYASESGAVACDPAAKGSGGSTSYPSGSASTGWLWGLILAEAIPAQAGDALAFGASVGDNRVACRVHYPSDIAAGRMVGAAVFAAERSSPAFRADLELAKAELVRAAPRRC